MTLFSIIIPVYNRTNELEELLDSLTKQSNTNLFEVIVVDDGSSQKCDTVLYKFPSLQIKYYYKENGGPAAARNYGAKYASGEWLLFFDSDCIIPPHYISNTYNELNQRIGEEIELFGGADRSHPSFTPLQKGIDYSMTSILTTGGIRGGKKSADKFHPRTFNMGIKKEVFEKIGGFSNMRFGEDVDFSYKVQEGGYKSALFVDSWVYHKRRNTFRTFFKQVHNSGIARIHLSLRHPGTLKLVHLLPALFLLGSLLLITFSITWTPWWITPLGIMALTLLVDSTLRYKSIKTGLMAVIASFVQLYGYGSGFLSGFWHICILKQRGYAAFVKNFYK